MRVRTTTTAPDAPAAGAFGATFPHPTGAPAAAPAAGTHAAVHRLNMLIERQSGRIAAVLHDEVSQVLAATHMTLEDIACDVTPAVQARLRQVRAHLHEVENQLRGISRQLHPAVVEDFGLTDAITFTARAFTRRTGIRLGITCEPEMACPAAAADVVFRVVQEALANVAAHAHATAASIALAREDADLVCTVCDDGAGFDAVATLADPRRPQLGLHLLRARVEAAGGTFAVTSAPRQGTCLRATVPVER